MPRGPAPAWRTLAPHTQEAIPYVRAALAQGLEIEFTWRGIPTKERAHDLRRGIFNAARHHAVSVSADAEPACWGEWRIRFTLHDKRAARALHVQRHGADRSQWPYDPRRKDQ